MTTTVDGTAGITFPSGAVQASGLVSADTNWKYRALRLDFDGTSGDTVAYEYCSLLPNALTNGAALSSVQKKFGSTSMLCSPSAGSGKPQLSLPIPTIGTSNFTLEMWAYVTSYTTSSFPAIFDLALSTTSRVGLYFTSSTNTVLRLDGSTNNLTTSTIGLTLNAWNYVTVERVGTTLTLYINGISAGAFTYSTSISNTWVLYVGSTIDGYSLSGYIDDLRLTSGLTVYGGAFTPPSSALPTGIYSISTTSLH